MRKIAIVTDTASDISIDDAKKYDIKILHYQIVYKDKTYKDQLEITAKEVIDTLEEEVPTTSLPSLDEIHEVFDELVKEGYKEVLVIPLSSGLSGCFNAINMVKEDYQDLNAVVYDSRTISAAQAVLAIKAAEMADAGCEMKQIISELDKMRENQNTLFIVDTLKYLLLGGRIGHVSAAVGKLLNLKPIITIGDDGKYETVAKVRGRAKAISYFVNKAQEILKDGKEYKLYFSHAAGEEIKDKIIALIKEVKPDVKIEGVCWISPVACVHCGPGYVGMLIQRI
ncbi:DegV family protein [Cellulosilyticum sp. WCF-2]|uniref:DegV family protein n=1 Tax=Cellulosilyticum sp. WCF-2 TaxID=2497860 RepID=UPI000F8CFAD4|nr:DegV family protein [Cellulosilyticum sp. WCF-2]QEH70866.1 DegV family protein [Cellulosilyticum sp. WCF-2]